jgi:hypothetical protein
MYHDLNKDAASTHQQLKEKTQKAAVMENTSTYF